MTPEELSAIEARANAAKEHKFESECDGTFECPLCGEGILDGRLYDSKTEAATVIAYGIGNGLQLAKEWVENGPEDILALVAEVRMLRYLLGKECSMAPAKEHDLEVWRQAYNAALSCPNVCNTEACDCANSALIDYRAKREEMGR